MVLRRNFLQKKGIFCELYLDTRSGVSDYSNNESLGSDSDVPTISITIFPHIYQDNYHNSVRLAQTLLDKNVRVCGMRANRGIPHDLEREVNVPQEW